MQQLFGNPLFFVFEALALLLAITIHEFAHAYAADRLGDPTPRLMGRVTLNPLAHLDPIGTLMILFAPFGWGKPVQFDPFNLRNPRRDAAIISIAGPASNLALALVAAILLRIMLLFQSQLLSHASAQAQTITIFIAALLEILIVKNIILAIFNLIPIHPLDGFKIVGGLLSHTQARDWYSLERYGIFFLLMLILPLFNGTAAISFILTPIFRFLVPLFIPQVNGLI